MFDLYKEVLENALSEQRIDPSISYITLDGIFSTDILRTRHSLADLNSYVDEVIPLLNRITKSRIRGLDMKKCVDTLEQAYKYAFILIGEKKVNKFWNFLAHITPDIDEIIKTQDLWGIIENGSCYDYENEPKKAKFINDSFEYSTPTLVCYSRMGAFSVLLQYFMDVEHNDILINFFEKIAKYLHPKFIEYIINTVLPEIGIDTEYLNVFKFMFSLEAPETLKTFILEPFLTTLSLSLYDNTEKSLDCIETILSDIRPNQIDFLDGFIVDLKIDEENERFVKDFSAAILVLYRYHKWTKEALFEYLRNYHKMIPYIADYCNDLPGDIIEIFFDFDKEKASRLASLAYEKGNATFSDEKMVLKNILIYGNDDYMWNIRKSDNYEKFVNELAEEEYDDNERYMLNLCKALSKTEVRCDLSNLSNSLLDVLDSSYIAEIFDMYSFLPIPDSELFVSLCDDGPKLFKILEKHELYPHVSVKSSFYTKWAMKAFKKTKDAFFAQKIVENGEEGFTQVLVNQLHSLDFIIDAFREAPNDTKQAIKDVNYDSVVPRDYINDIKELPKIFDILHLAPKFKYDFNDSKEFMTMISELPPLAASYLVDCALSHANDLFFKNIDVSLIQLTNSYYQALVMLAAHIKSGTINDDILCVLLKNAAHNENIEAVKEILKHLPKQRLTEELIISLSFSQDNVVDTILQVADIPSNIVNEILPHAPPSVYPKLFSIANKDDDLVGVIKDILNNLLLVKEDPASYESVYVPLINELEGETAAEEAAKAFFAPIPSCFRTKEVCKATLNAFAKCPEVLSRVLMDNKAESDSSSPFIRAVGQITSFITESDSKLANDACLAHLDQNVNGYKDLKGILQALTDDFALEVIEFDVVNKYCLLKHLTSLKLPSAPSVLQALIRFSEITAGNDEKANSTLKRDVISKVSDYLALSLTEYPNMIIDEEIDAATFTVPSVHKIMKLASFVGKSRKGEFLLNDGTPVLAFYTSDFDSTESQFFFKVQELYHSSISNVIRSLDFSGFPVDPSLALVLMSKYNSSEMFERGLDDPEFVSGLFEKNIEQIAKSEFNEESEKLVLKAASLFEAPELLFTIALEFLNSEQSLRLMTKIFIAAGIDIDSIIEDLDTNSINIEPIIDLLDKNMHEEYSEKSLTILASNSNLKKIIIMKEKDEYIKYILPLKECDVDVLINNCSNDYTAKVLIQNGDKKLAERAKTKLFKNSAFNRFIGAKMSAAETVKMIFEGDEKYRKLAIKNLVEDIKENGLMQNVEEMISSYVYKMSVSGRAETYVYDLFIAIGDLFIYFSAETMLNILMLVIMVIQNEEMFIPVLKMIKQMYAKDAIYIKNDRLNIIFPFVSMKPSELNMYMIEAWIHILIRQEKSFSPSSFMAFGEKVISKLSKECYKRIAEDLAENITVIYDQAVSSLLLIFTSIHRYLVPYINDKGFDNYLCEIALIQGTIFPAFAKHNIIVDPEGVAMLSDAVIDRILSCNRVRNQKDIDDYAFNLYRFKLVQINSLKKNLRSPYIHIVANLMKIDSDIMEWATDPSFIEQIQQMEYSTEFAYFAETLFIEAAAEAESPEDEMLYVAGDVLIKALRMAIDSGIWNDINRLLKVYSMAIKSSAKNVVSFASFYEYYSALQYIPLNEDVSYLKLLTMQVIKNNPDSYDIDGVKDFFNSFDAKEGESVRLAIAVILVKKCPTNKLPCLKNDAIRVFSNVAKIKEYEKQCKQIIESFK